MNQLSSINDIFNENNYQKFSKINIIYGKDVDYINQYIIKIKVIYLQ